MTCGESGQIYAHASTIVARKKGHFFEKVDSLFLLFDRFSSVQLLGDLLFHISGVTGKMTTETASEDDNFGTAASNKV